MRLPRLTTRWLMVIAAVAGILIGIGIGISSLVGISQRGGSKAQVHAFSEEMDRDSARFCGKMEALSRERAKALRARRAESVVESIRAAALARISPEAMEAWRESEALEREIGSSIEASEGEADEFRRQAEKHLRAAVSSATKRRKYERAARYP